MTVLKQAFEDISHHTSLIFVVDVLTILTLQLASVYQSFMPIYTHLFQIEDNIFSSLGQNHFLSPHQSDIF